NTRRGLYGSVAVLVGAIVLIVFAIVPNYARLTGQPADTAPQTMATIDPTIIANLTVVPNMPPPTGDEAQQLHDLQVQVDACADYSDARREQMAQHIRWLLNPPTIPGDILLAAGKHPLARLIFGMAVYTSSEWRLKDRPADSCLIEVGRTLNDMLVTAGEEALTIYDE
ncbi:MAG: hypothetical protein K8J31_10785, partial [Anaerolineae bacterium]|nr:hypothetical protein [Anaerolineae bacterium]